MTDSGIMKLIKVKKEVVREQKFVGRLRLFVKHQSPLGGFTQCCRNCMFAERTTTKCVITLQE